MSARRRPGQTGVTLLEILIAVAVIGLIGVPVTAWAISTVRQQDLAQHLIRNAIATGNLGRELSGDVATARQLHIESGGDCVGGEGAGGSVRLALITGGATPSKVVYTEADASSGVPGRTSLWRRECGTDGTLRKATELFEQVVPGSVHARCAPAGGGPGPAPGAACPNENRRLRLELTPARPASANTIEVHATRRTSSGTHVTPGQTNSPPIALAHVTPLVGYSDTQFQFSAAGSWDPDGDTLSYSWEFPDGSIATGATTSRRFNGGEHLVLLRVDDGRGGIHATPVTVRVINQYPVAVASVSPASGAPGEEFTFSAALSHDPDGGALTYHWDLGDGRTASGVEVRTTYSVSGEVGAIQATLTVTDDQGASDTTAVTVGLGVEPGDIRITPPPVGTGPNRLPRVGSVSPGQPLEVSFASDVQQAGTRWVLTRSGEAEPVATSDGEELRHTFAPGDAGEYRIARQWTESGNPFGDPVDFRVNAAPTAAFDFTAAGPGGVTELRGGGVDPDGTIVSYRWYGLSTYWNGNLANPDSTNPNPQQVFPNPGTYEVTLVVTDDDGASASVTRQVRIPGTPTAPPPPVWQGARVAWDPVPGAEEYRVAFYCSSVPGGSVDVPSGPSPSAPVPADFCGGGAAAATVTVRANGVWGPSSTWGNR